MQFQNVGAVGYDQPQGRFDPLQNARTLVASSASSSLANHPFWSGGRVDGVGAPFETPLAPQGLGAHVGAGSQGLGAHLGAGLGQIRFDQLQKTGETYPSASSSLESRSEAGASTLFSSPCSPRPSLLLRRNFHRPRIASSSSDTPSEGWSDGGGDAGGAWDGGASWAVSSKGKGVVQRDREEMLFMSLERHLRSEASPHLADFLERLRGRDSWGTLERKLSQETDYDSEVPVTRRSLRCRALVLPSPRARAAAHASPRAKNNGANGGAALAAAPPRAAKTEAEAEMWMQWFHAASTEKNV